MIFTIVVLTMKKQLATKKTSPQKPKQVKSNAPKTTGDSFFKFLTAKPQMIELLCITLGLVIIHILLYNWYPTPCTYYDTNNYLQSAEAKTFMGYRPYGYSWFLIF